MAASATAQLEIAATLVRLYVFLSQYLDRCLDVGVRRSAPAAIFRRTSTKHASS